MVALEKVLLTDELFKKGAEAHIFFGTFLEKEVVIKKRLPKSYRIPPLDYKIRSLRTKREARILETARIAGVSVPGVVALDIGDSTIVLERIRGKPVNKILETGTEKIIQNVMRVLGEETGKLHNARVYHGDLTVYNAIQRSAEHSKGGKIVIIDFGLSEVSGEVEKWATDLQCFSNTLKAIDPDNSVTEFQDFLEGYKITAPKYKETTKQVQKIEARGRYVAREDRFL